MVSTVDTSVKPCARKASMTPATSSSGTDAPDEMPTASTPSNHDGSSSFASSTRCARPRSPNAPCATSMSRTELEEFADPTITTLSDCSATSFTAAWRLDVA